MPPIRVYFLAFKSKTGCLFSSLTLKQGVKFVLSPQTMIHTHSTAWHPLIGFNLFLSQRQPVACNSDWLSPRTTCHAVLVANRNKRLVALYRGSFCFSARFAWRELQTFFDSIIDMLLLFFGSYGDLSFDVFNIFIVIIDIQYKYFLGFLNRCRYQQDDHVSNLAPGARPLDREFPKWHCSVDGWKR